MICADTFSGLKFYNFRSNKSLKEAEPDTNVTTVVQNKGATGDFDSLLPVESRPRQEMGGDENPLPGKKRLPRRGKKKEEEHDEKIEKDGPDDCGGAVRCHQADLPKPPSTEVKSDGNRTSVPQEEARQKERKSIMAELAKMREMGRKGQ